MARKTKLPKTALPNYNKYTRETSNCGILEVTRGGDLAYMEAELYQTLLIEVEDGLVEGNLANLEKVCNLLDVGGTGKFPKGTTFPVGEGLIAYARAEGRGAIIATSNEIQEEESGYVRWLQALGFKEKAKFFNPNSGNDVKVWIRLLEPETGRDGFYY